jgi:hypothetical protein
MKKLHVILIVLVFSQLIAPSCSKKSSGSTPACQIITIVDQLGTTTTTFNITYNNAGQISTEQYVNSGTNYNKVFTYISSTENITTNNGTTTTTDSITQNSDGLIESDYNQSGTTQTVSLYTYSGTELQKEVTTVNGGTPVTTTYTWSNGNPVSSSDGTTTTTYTYNTKPTEVGDYFQIVQLLNYGGTFVKTANQLTGYSVGSTIENVNYTYDNTGKITALTGTSGSTVENITYQYSCN